MGAFDNIAVNGGRPDDLGRRHASTQGGGTAAPAGSVHDEISVPRTIAHTSNRFHFERSNSYGHRLGYLDIEVDKRPVPNKVTVVQLKQNHWEIRANLEVNPRPLSCERGLWFLDLHHAFGCLHGPVHYAFLSRNSAEDYLSRTAEYVEGLPGFQYWIRRDRGCPTPYPAIDREKEVIKLWLVLENGTSHDKKQIERLMAETLSGCKIKTRLTLHGMMGVLRDGRVKHFRELPENAEFVASGIINQRDVIDQRWYQSPPLYGYADPLHGHNRKADAYGSVDIVWRDSVKEHTTVTFGDSLTNYQYLAKPTPFTAPKYFSAVPHFALQWTCPDDIWKQITDGRIEYIEANQSGKRKLSDIDRVIIHQRPDDSPAEIAQLESMLNRARIPCEIRGCP